MKELSVPMALVDFIPVLFFAAAVVILMHDLYNKMGKASFALFSAGVINVTSAGMLKALYKLLYAANVCDFEMLSTIMFPLQSVGFLLAGIGAVMMLCRRQTKNAMLSIVAPPFFGGTVVFIASMIAGLALMDAVLCRLCAKLKKPWIIVLFVLSFACSLCMGALSSQNFAEAAMNWIAEGINIVGQSCLLTGVVLLHKNGLADLALRSE